MSQTCILAEISIGEWVMIAATVGMFIVALIALLKKAEVSVSPQPLQIELAKKFADKHDFEKHVEENARSHEAIFSRIGGVDRGNGQKISTEITAVHTRINSIEKSIGGLEATAELQSQQLARMDAKLDRLAEKSNYR